MNTRQQSKDRPITLTPGKEISVDVSGAYFFIESADGPISISFNDGPYMSARSGLEVNNFEFQKIKFRSDVTAGGATITVRYYAGTAYITNRNPIVYSKPAPTDLIAYSAALAAGDTYDIPNTNLRTGQPYADKQVRVEIQTASPTGYLEMYQGGTYCGFTATSSVPRIFETPKQITIKAISAPITYAVAVYYQLPT
jgi:hypothetical protein